MAKKIEAQDERKTYVICGSHRAAQKLADLLDGTRLANFFHFKKKYQLTEIPTHALPQALLITGVRRGVISDDWHSCSTMDEWVTGANV